MNTEPPVGDDLQQVLVSMKQTVLERAAAQRPRRTKRRIGIAIGIVAFLAVGGASGALALGIIPQPVAAPTAAPSATEPPATRTPSSAPITATPTTTPSPTAPARPAFAIDDPSTWTISGDEVGPLALGGAYEEEYDDLRLAYSERSGNCPARPSLTGWERAGSPSVALVERDGKLAAVHISDYSATPAAGTGPMTAEGIGVGSTLQQVHATYPEAQYATQRGIDPSVRATDPQSTLPFGGWTIERGGYHITFVPEQYDDSGVIQAVWIDPTGVPPYELCG